MALELLPVPRDHQQRVVDPERQPHHPDDREREEVDLGEVEQKAQYPSGRGDDGAADDHRHQRRENRSEDQQQHDEQYRHGDQLADGRRFVP